MSVRNVLIVGGGFTGLTTAIALAQRGIQVTLVEKVSAWARVGHGLTIQGNALRVFAQIGVIDDVLAVGQAENGVRLTLANGALLSEMQTPRTGGDDLPATIGALRPDLHEILVAKAEALGVEIRLGLELTAFETHGDTATSTLSDGRVETWDLIVVAEGIKSQHHGRPRPERARHLARGDLAPARHERRHRVPDGRRRRRLQGRVHAGQRRPVLHLRAVPTAARRQRSGRVARGASPDGELPRRVRLPARVD